VEVPAGADAMWIRLAVSRLDWRLPPTADMFARRIDGGEAEVPGLQDARIVILTQANLPSQGQAHEAMALASGRNVPVPSLDLITTASRRGANDPNVVDLRNRISPLDGRRVPHFEVHKDRRESFALAAVKLGNLALATPAEGGQ
jgi:hypothetical protein